MGAGIGGAFIGAGIGYGIGESLFPANTGTLYTRNYFYNVGAFYKGLFSPNSVGNFASATNHAFVPDIWGSIGSLSIGNISLPKIKLPDIKLPRIIEWVPDIQRITDYTDGPSIKLNDIKTSPVYKNYPNYQTNLVLPPLANGGQYTLQIPRDANLSMYNVTPSNGPIQAGPVNISITLNVPAVVVEEVKYNQEINLARRGGMETRQFEDNRQKNIRDMIRANNEAEIKIRVRNTITRPYKYPRIFGIPLKFIKIH